MAARVCFSEQSFIHSFKVSFRNKAIGCSYEWATESLTHSINPKTWIHSVTKHRCVARRHTTVLLWLWSQLYSSAKLSKNTQYFVKSKSLNFIENTFLFIEILLYKISVTLQSCWYWYSGKHHVAYLNIYVHFFFLPFLSMHLYISVRYFVCAVSLTRSLRLCKPHLARHKYIISCLHWMQLKLELFSCETMCLHATECARGCDVSACTTGNKRIGSDHWPINQCISTFIK